MVPTTPIDVRHRVDRRVPQAFPVSIPLLICASNATRRYHLAARMATCIILLLPPESPRGGSTVASGNGPVRRASALWASTHGSFCRRLHDDQSEPFIRRGLPEKRNAL